MTTVTVDESGNVRLPDEVLRALDLSPGGKVDFEILRDGAGAIIILRKHNPADDRPAVGGYSSKETQA